MILPAIMGATGAWWTPKKITTALWLDAADSDTITLVSDAVSEWADKSGNDRHATQGSAGNRPGYTSSTVTFDGTNDFLVLPSGFLNAASDFTFAFVSHVNANNNAGMFGPSTSHTTGIEITSSNVMSMPSRLRINGTIYFGTNATFSSDGTNFSITAYTANSTAVLGWMNGTSVTPEVEEGISAADFNGVYALGRYASTGYIKCSIQEFIVLPAVAAIDDRQKLEGYLAHKWGLTANLPSGHPYKSRRPRG